MTPAALSGDGYDNAYEVLNVMASAYNQTGEDKHVKLAAVLAPADAPDPAVAAVLAAPSTQAHYSVEIKGYPVGRLSALAM